MTRAWTVALLLLVACRDEPTPGPPLEVLAHAASIQVDAAGELETVGHEGSVTLWVAGAEPEVRIDGARVDAAVSAAEGGHRFVLDVPDGAQRLVVERQGRHWTTSLQRMQPTGVLAEIGDGNTEEDLARLERALDEAVGSERAALLSRAGRVALARGDDQRALGHLRAGRDAHRELGNATGALLDATAASWVSRRRRWDLNGASADVESVLDWTDVAPVAGARVVRAYAAVRVADGAPEEAVTLLASVEQIGLRLGVSELAVRAMLGRAELEHSVGRTQASRRGLDRARALAEGCVLGEVAVLESWLQLLDAEQGASLEMNDFVEAERVLADCGDTDEAKANAAVNTALAAAWGGDIDAAREALARARAAGGGALVRAWELELDGRVAMAEDQHEAALRAYDELGRRARAAGSFGIRWRAALGRGRALEELGMLSEARTAYEEAEAALDDEVTSLSLGAAPGLVGRRWLSAARLAALELSQGHSERALAVLRHARRRPIVRATPQSVDAAGSRRAFAARQALEADAASAWELPENELVAWEAERAALRQELSRAHADARVSTRQRPREDDELLVVVFPHESGRLVVASRGEGRTEGALVGADAWPDLSALAQGARVARIAGAGPHVFAVPAELEIPVVHAMDIHRDASSRAGGGALVVVDPTGNLRAARAEGRGIADRIGGTTLVGEDANFDALVDRLPRVDALYYAGHAREGEGLAGAVRLAHGELTAADVLALPRVPRSVVLNGCDTASGAGLVPVGVAQAFVLRGAERVLASIRPVDDTAAAAVTRRLLAADDSTTGWALALASNPSAPSFRVLVP